MPTACALSHRISRASSRAWRLTTGVWLPWDWLKGVVATITHFIVSVAEEIYVGIRLIVDGVVHVFKQVVHVVEEVAHAIGALFVELAKAIEKVLEALSVLFHFGEIV